jgi:hypothetical protein
MRIGTLLLAALLGVTAVSAFQLHRQLETERARTAALEARVRDLDRAPPAPAAGTPALPPPAEPAIAATPPPAARVIAGRAPANAAAHLQSPFGEVRTLTPEDRERLREAQIRQRRLLKDPEYRAAMIEQSKLAMRQMYADAASELGLSAVEMDRVLTLLAERSVPDPEMITAYSPPEPGSPPDEAQVRRWREFAMERQRQRDADLRNLLGDSRFSQWQDFERALPERQQARQLRHEFASAGVPLNREQEQALGRLLADEQRRMQDEHAKTVPAGTPKTLSVAPSGAVFASRAPISAGDAMRRQREILEATERSNQRLRDAAASILTPEQLAALMQQREAQVATQRASLRIQETTAKLEAESAGATR